MAKRLEIIKKPLVEKSAMVKIGRGKVDWEFHEHGLLARCRGGKIVFVPWHKVNAIEVVEVESKRKAPISK